MSHLIMFYYMGNLELYLLFYLVEADVLVGLVYNLLHVYEYVLLCMTNSSLFIELYFIEICILLQGKTQILSHCSR